jgi:hypothetical protein
LAEEWFPGEDPGVVVKPNTNPTDPAVVSTTDAEEVKPSRELSIEEELAQEIASLKKQQRSKKQRFRWEEIGCSSFVFIAVNDSRIEPSSFLKRTLDDVRQLNSSREFHRRFRVSHRILPIQQTCMAHEDAIKSTLKALLHDEWSVDKSTKTVCLMLAFFFFGIVCI